MTLGDARPEKSKHASEHEGQGAHKLMTLWPEMFLMVLVASFGQLAFCHLHVRYVLGPSLSALASHLGLNSQAR